MRSSLVLNDLEDAAKECRRLHISGYQAKGNWSLGQICNHIRLTMESNMRGYPKWMTAMGYPLRPVLRKLVLPRLLAGRSINGVRTAGMYVPDSELNDEVELKLFEQCVENFINSTDQLHTHPGFGNMPRDQFNRFHAAHAAHHLSFLQEVNS